MSRVSYSPPLGLLLLGDRPGLGLERTPRRADPRQVESTYNHHRPINNQQRKTEEASDSAFHREYWEPCNSTYREYIVNGCTW
jgi:hypothetical protein